MANLHIFNFFNLKTVTGTLEDHNGQMYCIPDASEQAQVTTSRKPSPPIPRTPKNNLVAVSAVCLGLLCVLPLALILGLWFYHSEERAQWETGQQELLTSNNNLTKERDRLETGNNNLTKERDQLKNNYNNLTKERDQLKNYYNNLTKERDQLKNNYNNLTKERDQLKNNYNNLTKERDQLETIIQNLANELQVMHEMANSSQWYKLGFSWYYNSTELKNWNQSRQDCLSRRADLVIINSREEEALIVSLFKKRAWIGLTDIEVKKTWKWVDGTFLNKSLSFWDPPQPDNGGTPSIGEEDCGEIYKEDGPVLGWNDLSCVNNNYWICEKAI